MLTKEYNDKMSRRNERIARLWKWRWLFVAILAILVAAVVLMCLVGTVTDSYCESTVEYGIAPKLTSNAIFGEVNFRYRSIGSEWTYSAPVDVGNYEVQAVSKSLIGRERLGKIMRYNVTAANLTVKVTDDEVDFGNLPKSVSADLKYGDKLILGKFDVTYGDKTVDVTPVGEDIRVTDGDGNDVTSNYNITVQTKTLICHPISAKITTQSAIWIYDGQPHKADEVTTDGLLAGHCLADVTTDVIIDAGTVPNGIRYRILDEDGNDVTVHYDVDLELGELRVDKRVIYVTTATESFVYNGKAQSCPHASCNEDGLAEGHSIVAVEWAEIADVGEKENSAKISVTDGNVDMTANYETNVRFGTISVAKRPLTISTGSVNVTYDGRSYGNTTPPAVVGLADTDIFTMTDGDDSGWKQIQNVGSIENSVGYAVTDKDGGDVIGNYQIEERWGELTVKQRNITVTTVGETWIYDGQSHSHAEGYSTDDMLADHTVTFSDWASVANVGSADNKPRVCKVVDKHGTDVTKNFNFIFKCGKLVVNKRVFVVQTADAAFVFDGAPHKDLQYSLVPSDDPDEGLLTGHRVTESASTGVINITDASDSVGYVDNVQTYTISDGDGNDVSANYLPRGVWGKIRVKAPIKVRVHNLSKIYDGTPLSYKPTDWIVESVPAGVDKTWVQVALCGSLTEVGVLNMDVLRAQSVVSVTDDSGNDLLADSDDPNRVDFVGSPLRVLPIPITVTSISVARKNNGVSLSGNVDNAAWISVGSLFGDHRIQFFVTGELRPESITAQNTVAVSITDVNGRDVSKYYDVTYVFGTLSWL